MCIYIYIYIYIYIHINIHVSAGARESKHNVIGTDFPQRVYEYYYLYEVREDRRDRLVRGWPGRRPPGRSLYLSHSLSLSIYIYIYMYVINMYISQYTI